MRRDCLCKRKASLVLQYAARETADHIQRLDQELQHTRHHHLGVHNIEGINRWVRVVNAGEAQKAEKETAVALIDRGWKVSKSAGDAALWNADDLDDDF